MDFERYNIFEKFEVIPETVSQFTGKYINNTRIFDGDILEWRDDSWGIANAAVTRLLCLGMKMTVVGF